MGSVARSGIPMIEDLLKLSQWLSPSFPVGSFAYSHGLEAAIVSGDVVDEVSLQQWVSDVLEFGSGRSDAILLCATLRGEAEVLDHARALAGSAERWRETSEQGTAFLAATNAIYDEEETALPLPVAVGRVARRLALSPEQVASLYLHGFSSNLVSAAVRFVPLGQAAGQKVLAGLHPVIAKVAQEASTAELEDIFTASFGAELAAMQHEHMDVRVFKT